DLIPHINPLRIAIEDLALGEKRANVVVRGNVEKFCLRAPGLGRPVFAASDARTELGSLFRARTLGLVDDGTSCLRVNRREHVVIGKRESVQEVETIAIQYPEITVSA